MGGGTIGVPVIKYNNHVNCREFLNELDTQITDISNKGANIIAVPGLISLAFLPARVKLEDVKNYYSLVKLFLLDNEAIVRKYKDFFCEASSRNQIYILGGTILEVINSKLYNLSYLLSPKGEMILRQGQTHLSRMERQSNLLHRCDTVDIAHTPYGNIGIAVGIDSFYPEVSRILALKGAELILNPQAYYYKYSTDYQYSGMWNMSQQNQVFSCEAFPQGKVGAMSFIGVSSIYGPCDCTKDLSGIYARQDEKSIDSTTSELDYNCLDIARRSFKIRESLNPSLYSQQLWPELWR